MERALANAWGADRCGTCGLQIKWGQERTVLDASCEPPRALRVCPVCAIERGQWPGTPSEGVP